MELLVLVVLAGAALIVVPVLLFKALVALILLPFRLISLVFKALFGVASAVGGLLLGVFALLLLPLLPFLIVGGLIWLIVRPSHGSLSPRLTA